MAPKNGPVIEKGVRGAGDKRAGGCAGAPRQANAQRTPVERPKSEAPGTARGEPMGWFPKGLAPPAPGAVRPPPKRRVPFL